jgi:hypothetical protein
MASNLERDARWFNTQGVVENELSYPAPDSGNLVCATSGILNVKQGFLQSTGDVPDGEGDAAVGVIMRGPLEGNTMYTVSWTSSISTGWIGVARIASPSTSLILEPTWIVRGQGGLIQVCIRKETVPFTNDTICFFHQAPTGTNVITSLQIQRLAAKPDGYISAVC